jgi:peptidoglycan/LPS O-acetylase OafA/YrhL
MLAMPVGVGQLAAPLCLPYIVIFAGLSAVPGRSLLKRDLSYGVYLIHAPVLTAFCIWYPGLRPWWVVAFVVGVVTLPLSFLLSTLVERPALARKKMVAKWIGDRLNRIQTATGRLLGASVSEDRGA